MLIYYTIKTDWVTRSVYKYYTACIIRCIYHEPNRREIIGSIYKNNNICTVPVLGFFDLNHLYTAQTHKHIYIFGHLDVLIMYFKYLSYVLFSVERELDENTAD